MGSIFSGLILIALGTAMLKYSRQIYNFTGQMDFIESHWTGGTPSVLKLVAIIMVVLGLLFVTGLATSITGPLGQAFGQIFGPQR